MACDAATLEALIATNGYAKLSQHEVLMCLAGVLGLGALYPNAAVAVAATCTNKLQKLSDRELWMCVAQIFGSTNAANDVASAASNGMAKASTADLTRMFLSQVC